MELTPFRVFALLTRNLPNLLAIRFPVLAAACRVTISACGPRCLVPGSMNSRSSAVVLGCAKMLIGGLRLRVGLIDLGLPGCFQDARQSGASPLCSCRDALIRIRCSSPLIGIGVWAWSSPRLTYSHSRLGAPVHVLSVPCRRLCPTLVLSCRRRTFLGVTVPNGFSRLVDRLSDHVDELWQTQLRGRRTGLGLVPTVRVRTLPTSVGGPISCFRGQ